MKLFGTNDAPFQAPNGDVPDGAPEELNRPTNQFFNNIYGSLKRVIESSGLALTPTNGTSPDLNRLKDAIRQHAIDVAITATDDPTFADSSDHPASTNWIRGAMANIATSAGFLVHLSANGYLKLPNWLGGVLFQWGAASGSSSSDTNILFPIAYPTNCWQVVATCDYTIGSAQTGSVAVSEPSRLSFIARSTGNFSTRWFAIGN